MTRRSKASFASGDFFRLRPDATNRRAAVQKEDQLSGRHPSRICLIVHESRADGTEVSEIATLADERGVTIETRVAMSEVDGARLAREASAEKFDAVVAAGGDGTINAVVNGLAGTPTPLGIIPIGTANDFASQAGIPEDTREALDLILSRDPVRIDTGSLNGQYFVNVSTGGIGAETTSETSGELKALLGPLAYAITGIRKLADLDPMSIEVTAKHTQLQCEALIFAVGNARATGGGNLITPRARVDDGLLDICIVEAMAAASLLALLPKLRAGEHLAESGVHYFKAPEMMIRSSQPVTVNIDGEPVIGSSFAYRAHSLNLGIFAGQMLEGHLLASN